MKTTKKINILIIICSILAFISLVIVFLPFSFKKPSLDNTTEIDVTLTNIEFQESSITLHTYEYENKLVIRNKNSIEKMDEFKKLTCDDKIFVRIENSYINKLEEMPFVYISSLRYNDMYYISIESNNAILYNDDLKIQITGLIATLIFIITDIAIIAIKFKKKK